MRRIATLVSFTLALGLGGCATAPTTPDGSAGSSPTGAIVSSTAAASSPPQIAPTPDRVTGWRSDLERLVPAMETLHPDLFHGTPKAEIDRLVSNLEATVATASDDELMVGVSRVVALVSAHGRDSHTGLYPWSPASRFPVHSLPLRLWLFPDGIHVVGALAPYQDLVGARVDAIAGHPAADVVRALDPIVPRDNEATVRLLTPRYLLIPEVLHGLGMLGDAGSVDLGTVDSAGLARTVRVSPITMADYNAWAGAYGLFLPGDPKVLYLSRMDEALWWTRLGDGTLFVQYNRVDFLDDGLVRDLAAQAAAPDVKRVVIDIRHNFGGEVRALAPVVDALDAPAVDRPGHLFLILAALVGPLGERCDPARGGDGGGRRPPDHRARCAGAADLRRLGGRARRPARDHPRPTLSDGRVLASRLTCRWRLT